MQLKIITLNLRYDKPDQGNNAWTVRKEAIADLILKYKPDIIGTQEGKSHQLLDLHRLLPEYQSIGCDRNGDGTGEYCAIFYHQRMLRCLEIGNFALSNKPEVIGSISPEWENKYPRIVTYGIFMINRQRVAIFNTHLEYYSPKARELGAELIWERLAQLDLSDTYLFLIGDFNTDVNTIPRQTLAKPLNRGVKLSDAISILPREKQLTYHEFTGKGIASVDTIFYDGRVRINMVKVDDSKYGEVHRSDHFPVITEFTM
jgi:endonuclease/exonuclease/phosphatase family metal-dependent hydrolase